jgi:phage protein U
MSDIVWGLLGNLKFTAFGAPESLSLKESEDFAEIPLIGTKPVSQWVGTGLREVKLSIGFEYGWCNPATKYKELQTILTTHEPVALSIGDGTLNGNYYLQSIDGSVSSTLPTGEILAMQVSLSLTETTDEPVLPLEEALEVARNAPLRTPVPLKSNPFKQVRTAA